MVKMARRSLRFLIGAFALAVSCAPLGTSAGPPPYLYVALGDSITYGEFASHICAPRLPTRVEQCSGATNYPALLARMLTNTHEKVLYSNLGRSGAFTKNIIRDEVEYMFSTANLITLYVGRNDEIVISGMHHDGTETPGQPQRLADWKRDYATLIDAIRRRAPKATLVLATVPNDSWFPAHRDVASLPAAFSIAEQKDFSAINSEMNAFILRLGFPVIDLWCDPENYVPANFSDSDHPSDLGYAHLAATFYATIMGQAPPARDTCPPYSEAPND